MACLSVVHLRFATRRQVDTHIHAAACMNQKRLLTFIKKKLKNEGGEVVYLDRNGQGMTLNQIFEEMNVSAYDLSVDLLDVHVVRQVSMLHGVLNFLVYFINS